MRVYELFEAVGSNYLYHATSPQSLMRILKSGQLNASYRPQPITRARTSAPTISTTRNKSYAESDDFVNFLNMTQEGNVFVLILDRNSLANRYRMFSTSQGTQTHGDEYEEVIVAPKGSIPLQGVLRGFYLNPKRINVLQEEGFLEFPWFKIIMDSPYFLNKELVIRSKETV